MLIPSKKYRAGKLLKMGVILLFFLGLFFSAFVSSSCQHSNGTQLSTREKINGISLVAPPRSIDSSWTGYLSTVNASWVAIIPYAYCPLNGNEVIYNNKNSKWRWWGEQPEGVITTIKHAKKAGKKVMLKPHLWFMGSWPGDFNPDTEDKWKIWEEQYSKYILDMAQIADSLNVDLFCIGTELKHSVTKRSSYWITLIDAVRQQFPNKITYAANWDCYDQITLWEKLDYIGIDAYFPLSSKNTPTSNELLEAWKPIEQKISSVQQKYGKPILFTEYGYRSMDGAGWKNWEKENNYNVPVNCEGQFNCYEALFKTFWSKDWFSGGFIWKWYHNHPTVGGSGDTDYTPQNKPVSKLISTIYRKN